MRDTEDLLGEDFEWTDEPRPGTDIASRQSKPSLRPRSLTGDVARFRGRAAASPRSLLLLTLAVTVLGAIVVAVVVLAGGSKQATRPAQTTSPATTPPRTQSQPGAAPTARPAIVVSPVVTLRAGDHGPAVRTLQRALRRLGFTIGLDGVFGAKTEAAVIAFQRAHGLSADGLVGAKTARALNRALARAR